MNLKGRGDRAAFGRALGEILRKLGMPFAGLGRNRALGRHAFFCCAAHIKALV